MGSTYLINTCSFKWKVLGRGLLRMEGFALFKRLASQEIDQAVIWFTKLQERMDSGFGYISLICILCPQVNLLASEKPHSFQSIFKSFEIF
jgi:hypothetical protein